jgi:hypothetical protein
MPLGYKAACIQLNSEDKGQIFRSFPDYAINTFFKNKRTGQDGQGRGY